MPRIGIVGPASSIERILDVASKMELKLDFIPFPYTETQAAANIVKTNQTYIDGWLFSGPAPLIVAQSVLAPSAIFACCLNIGASLYRCFIQLSQELNRPVGKVSIDMPEEVEIDEALAEIQLPRSNMHLMFYNRHFNVLDLVNYHKELFLSGQADGAITSLEAVYLALKALGIPVWRNTPTKMEIKLTLQIISEKITASYFKNTQVGLEIIDVELHSKVDKMLKSPYELQYLELDIKRTLLQLSKKLDGYLIEKGSGRYEIFSSRGAVEREISALQDTIEEIRLQADVPVWVGIGFGETFYAAEVNGYNAVNHAKLKQCGIVMIKDDGVLVEAVGKEDELQYEYYSQDSNLLAKLKQAGVSIKIYRKIMMIIKRMGWDSFTVSQLAEQLAVTDRNVSRIVSGLLRAELVQCIGEEAPAVRGRPSKMYQLPK